MICQYCKTNHNSKNGLCPGCGSPTYSRVSENPKKARIITFVGLGLIVICVLGLVFLFNSGISLSESGSGAGGLVMTCALFIFIGLVIAIIGLIITAVAKSKQPSR